MAKDVITQDKLKEVLLYEPDTGIFRWRKWTARVRINSIAGTVREDGYIAIKVCQKSYKAHRLAWLYVYGSWPKNSIDHIDGDITNNRIDNLRDVDHSMNMQNQSKAHQNNPTGILGVRENGRGKFTASIGIDGKIRYLGTFPDPYKAHDAYLAAKRTLHKGCTI